MADKTELIRQRMARTRESLGKKLDALEDRTLGVVKDTTDAVVNVAETVEQTVESATKAVQKTVKKSAKMLDLGRQVDKHPWPAMGAAVATGFFASWLVSRLNNRSEREADIRHYEPVPAGFQVTPEPQPAPQPEQPSLLSGIADMFAPSLDSLKNLAIGATVGVLKDLALQSVPREWTQQLDEVFNGLTEKLGGTPLPSASVEQPDVEPAQALPAPATPSEMRPRWEERPPETRPHSGQKKTHGNGRHSESANR